MAVVNIKQGFTYQHPDGYKEEIPPGQYDLEDELANSPYVRAFSDNPIKPKLRPGMPQHAAALAQYESAEGLTNNAETQIGEEAAIKARSEFRKTNQNVQPRRPNQRRRADEPQEDAQQEQRDEFEEQKRVAESMGQKLPDDKQPIQREQIEEPAPQQAQG